MEETPNQLTNDPTGKMKSAVLKIINDERRAGNPDIVIQSELNTYTWAMNKKATGKKPESIMTTITDYVLFRREKKKAKKQAEMLAKKQAEILAKKATIEEQFKAEREERKKSGSPDPLKQIINMPGDPLPAPPEPNEEEQARRKQTLQLKRKDSMEFYKKHPPSKQPKDPAQESNPGSESS